MMREMMREIRSGLFNVVFVDEDMAPIPFAIGKAGLFGGGLIDRVT